MGKHLKRLLGLEKLTPAENDYLNETNIRTSIYMSVVVISIEIWMILRTLLTKLPGSGMGFLEAMGTMKNFFLMLAVGVVMLVYAVRFMLGHKEKKWFGLFLCFVFAFACLIFGMYVSYYDIIGNKQILCFTTMIMFAACLLIWRPWISIAILTATFYLFYFILDRYALEDGMRSGDKINYFTFWLALAVLCTSIYIQRLDGARKDEEMQRINGKLRERTKSDGLTGVPNMYAFGMEATQVLEDRDTLLDEKIFLYLDVVNFKNYNEKYGFHEGNIFLKKIAELLQSQFPGDPFARFSDDHFVTLTAREGVEEKLESIRNILSGLEKDLRLGLKAGGHVPTKRDLDPRLACDRARYACGTIKKRYHHHFCIYDDKMHEEFRLKQYIINNIDTAIEEGYIIPYYQPVVWAKDHTLCGMEALARWIDPEMGFLSPGAFIPVLEEYRAIHKLDLCIIESVCRDISRCLNESLPIVPVSINFSRLDFEQTDIVGALEDYVEKYRVPKELLHIEITESALNDKRGVLKENMKRLKDCGYPVWLDDFGSGYSSLNVLKDYEFDVLKIDMAFLTNFGESERTKPILNSVVRMAESIGMRTLTEGVETEEQYDFLKSIGCERIQGFLFGKPMPLKDIIESIRKKELILSDEYIGNAHANWK